MMQRQRTWRLLAVAPAALLLAGCQSLSTEGPQVEPVAAVAPPGRAEDPLGDRALGKRHFRAQNFGLAETHFRRAVEADATDAESWLGLAASYDQLRRFDLADRAYSEAIRQAGLTSEILNNRGYSFMLRGDVARARKDLNAARAKDPQDPRIENNLRLLDNQLRSRR